MPRLNDINAAFRAAVRLDGKGQKVLRTGDGNSWILVPDYRGQTVYATDNSGPMEIKLPGEVPEGYTLLVPATPYDNWDGKKWVTDKEAQKLGQIAEADAQKEALIAAANACINEQNWPSKLALGRLSDADKAKFNAWLDYIDELNSLDISEAPDIDWPAIV
ncbi:tail fiber assembly protein [Cronobacter sakazakii]|nr:tail fiber assembly protein [Cronobacter sakazakii]